MTKKRSKSVLIPFKTTDPLGRLIICEQSAIDHLLIAHGELADEGELVKSGIEEPDQINFDKAYSNTEIYYRKFNDTILEQFGGKYLKIPVAISSTESVGFVKSAYITKRIKKNSERFKWKK